MREQSPAQRQQCGIGSSGEGQESPRARSPSSGKGSAWLFAPGQEECKSPETFATKLMPQGGRLHRIRPDLFKHRSREPPLPGRNGLILASGLPRLQLRTGLATSARSPAAFLRIRMLLFLQRDPPAWLAPAGCPTRSSGFWDAPEFIHVERRLGSSYSVCASGARCLHCTADPLQTRSCPGPVCTAAVVNAAGRGSASLPGRPKCQSQGRGLIDLGPAQVFRGTRKSGSSKWLVTPGTVGDSSLI